MRYLCYDFLATQDVSNNNTDIDDRMQFVIGLGCLKYKLTPEEVLTAVTLNGAAAIGMADQIGSVEVGKLGDLVVWDAPDLDYICYRIGSNLVKKVIKRGRMVP